MRSVFAAFALSDNNKKQSMIKLSGNDQKHLDVYHSLHIITKNHNDMSEDGYQSISCTKIVLQPMPWPRCFFFYTWPKTDATIGLSFLRSVSSLRRSSSASVGDLKLRVFILDGCWKLPPGAVLHLLSFSTLFLIDPCMETNQGIKIIWQKMVLILKIIK